jgi:MFS family permease
VALMPLYTVVSVAATFAFGALIDRIGSGRLLQLVGLPFALSFLVLAQAQNLGAAALGLAVFGICVGAQATVPSAFWAEFYGTRHLGAIKSLAMAVMVFGSAIGPGATAALIDAGIDFPNQMFGIAAYFLATGGCAALAVRRAQRSLPLSSKVDVIRA